MVSLCSKITVLVKYKYISRQVKIASPSSYKTGRIASSFQFFFGFVGYFTPSPSWGNFMWCMTCSSLLNVSFSLRSEKSTIFSDFHEI